MQISRNKSAIRRLSI